MSVLKPYVSFLTSACDNGYFVYLSGDALNMRFQTKILSFSEDMLVLHNSVTPEHIKDLFASNNFYLQVNAISIKSLQIDSDGKNLLFKAESAWEIEQTRKTKREEFTSQQAANCVFLNPYDKQTILRKKLVDFSEDGFSMTTFANSELFQNNSVIDDVDFFINEKKFMENKKARVRYTRRLIDFKGECHLQVGFSFLK